MSKREDIRARRKKERIRNRLIAIVGVVILALLVTFVLILPGIRGQQSATNITVITPVARKAAESGTSLGDPAAKVKLDVWEDFQCSGCKSYSDTIEPSIIQAYVDTGKVLYTFHNAPFIDGGAGESHQASNAAMCAMDQGRFWDFHDMLFANWLGENQGSFTETRLVDMARKLNLDMTAFNQCYKDQKYSQQILADYAAGQKLGVPPTPGIFINDIKVVSSQGENYIPTVDDISQALDAALASK
jgi:protein-disulfide isomerase